MQGTHQCRRIGNRGVRRQAQRLRGQRATHAVETPFFVELRRHPIAEAGTEHHLMLPRRYLVTQDSANPQQQRLIIGIQQVWNQPRP